MDQSNWTIVHHSIDPVPVFSHGIALHNAIMTLGRWAYLVPLQAAVSPFAVVARQLRQAAWGHSISTAPSYWDPHANMLHGSFDRPCSSCANLRCVGPGILKVDDVTFLVALPCLAGDKISGTPNVFLVSCFFLFFARVIIFFSVTNLRCCYCFSGCLVLLLLYLISLMFLILLTISYKTCVGVPLIRSLASCGISWFPSEPDTQASRTLQNTPKIRILTCLFLNNGLIINSKN